MIEIYQVLIEEVANGYMVFLYKADMKKEETKFIETHVFQAEQKNRNDADTMKLAKNRTFHFAKEKLGSKLDDVGSKFET